jgi:hypothetical protein
MTVSELIQRLEVMKSAHGDIDVYTLPWDRADMPKHRAYWDGRTAFQRLLDRLADWINRNAPKPPDCKRPDPRPRTGLEHAGYWVDQNIMPVRYIGI